MLFRSKKALEMFGSTSPSYLILQSLDLCNAYLANGYKDKLNDCIKKVEKLKMQLSANGWKVQQSDPLKLTALSTGINLSERLRQNAIECEYEDPDYTVMMFTPETPDAAYEKIVSASGVCDLEINPPELNLSVPEKCMEISDALFSQNERVSLENAVGRVVADTSVGCPPAVSVVVSGEKISEQTAAIMKYYGIDKITVVK